MTALESYLSKFTGTDWLTALNELSPDIHEVDRDAVHIWFRFYPIDIMRYIESGDDRDEAIRGLALQGDFELKDQIDTSHHFLYGHRFWPTVKRKIEKQLDALTESEGSLADTIKAVACEAARKLNVERPLVNAIVAIGLMTLNQVGADAFKASLGETAKPTGIMTKSPDAIVAERAKDDSQGLFGFLKTVDKTFSVAFSAVDHAGKFPVMNDQQMTHAAAKDLSQDWRAKDGRCWEGPIPVECTAASCGTCWIGVIGGREKLSEVAPRERRAMKVFGYGQPDDERPFLRLACQTKAYGNATIVIPPWNGVFGKKVCGNVEELELEPVTTSAKALRKTLADAANG